MEQERKAWETQQKAECLAAEALQAEKDALMNLSVKELLVEAIIALRGLYARTEELEKAYDALEEEIKSLKRELGNVNTDAARQNLEMASLRLQKH